MNLFALLKNKGNSFSAKLFYLLTFFILISYISFSAFFLSYQSKSMKSNLLHQGELLSRLLAYNSRLGVFAENEDLLEDPIEGIMQQKEVTLIQVFTEYGKQLTRHERNNLLTLIDPPLTHKREFEKATSYFSKNSGVFYFEEKEDIHFWAPVYSRKNTTDEELLFQKNHSPTNHNFIGLVKIVFTKKHMQKNLNNLLANNFIIPLVFIIPGWIIIFFVVKGITRPLKKLTEGVEAVGHGGSVKMVNVETKDEIGKLAFAFNNMVISLKNKEAEKKKIEEQLMQSQKMEAIGTLAGGIAHDFNNILSVIIGYVNLLQRKNDFHGSSKQYIENLLSTSERASSLIKSLLAFSRQQTVELQRVDISSVLKNLKNNLLRLIGENIEYKIVETENNLTALSDAGQIEQVLVNLAINARDSMPDGGTLTISTESVSISSQFLTFSGYLNPGEYVVISVTDTGTGLNKLTREKMFDPFYTTKEVGKGTGLGLSMVYGIIKQQNGSIDVISKPGMGTTFSVYLQLVKPDFPTEEPEQLIPFKRGTETILMAEDNADVRTLTRLILQESGYKVIVAVDGNDAVNKFIENRDTIDFLLLDLLMPKKNGLEAYNEIKKLKSDIKALFVSGHADDILHLKKAPGKNILRTEEAINFMPKPLLPDILTRKIQEILSK